MFFNFKQRLLSTEKPLVMGILNYTEDSFYDGGRYHSRELLVKRAVQMLDEGADIVDLGAVSTRPGAADLEEPIERERIVNAVRWILDVAPNAFISIDTWRASVAQAAIDAGAAMINDISGGTFEPEILDVVAQARVPYCLMHTTAKPSVMQQNTHYDNLLGEMMQFFGKQLAALYEKGINDVMLDPGFGFGKTIEQNWEILNHLDVFSVFNLPILVGLSRKSMFYKPLGITPAEALPATLKAENLAVEKGARILRVHDVKETVEMLMRFMKCNS